MLPIGAEVGFSSSGAGALGTLALLGLTPLDARRIVGTDLAFGLCLVSRRWNAPPEQCRLRLRLCSSTSIAGGILGALVGTGLASRIPVRTMRLALSLWLFVMGSATLLAGSLAASKSSVQKTRRLESPRLYRVQKN